MYGQKVHQRTLPVLANIFVLISIAEQIQLSLSFRGKLSFSLSTINHSIANIKTKLNDR